jgi:adenosine deaminase
MSDSLNNFIKGLPKAELHLHIEGSFEPELMFKIADKNKIKLKFKSIDELKAAYDFHNLQEFLDIYYQGANVLLTEEDFYDLTYAYFERIKKDNVKHAEIMFDPQTHTSRGISFGLVINSIRAAQEDAKKHFGISSKIIMSFLRHLSEDEAFQTLEQSKGYEGLIDAIGLDSSELGNPPSKFKNVFKEAKILGFNVVAHAGEEGPPEYVWDAINNLNIMRIDHGNKSLSDVSLTNHIIENKIPLTVCPLSNIKLCNVDRMENHPLKKMLDLGIIATVNSDDPAYFGGYVNDNFIAVTKSLNLSISDIYTLAKNSFIASFLHKDDQAILIYELDQYYNGFIS